MLILAIFFSFQHTFLSFVVYIKPKFSKIGNFVLWSCQLFIFLKKIANFMKLRYFELWGKMTFFGGWVFFDFTDWHRRAHVRATLQIKYESTLDISEAEKCHLSITYTLSGSTWPFKIFWKSRKSPILHLKKKYLAICARNERACAKIFLEKSYLYVGTILAVNIFG